MQVAMGVYYLVHNIAFIAWVLHHNSSQVSSYKITLSVKPEKSHDLRDESGYQN